MRKILLIVFFFAAAAIAIISLGELERTWSTLKQAEFGFVALAILLLLCWTLNDAAGYRSFSRHGFARKIPAPDLTFILNQFH